MAEIETPLAIYIHWPYCARICPYCDFNVYKNRSDTDLCAAIIDDLTAWRAWSGPRQVSSIHFGGGTPSLMRAADIQNIINHIRTLWTAAADIEIALEANPQDVDTIRWTDYRAAGVTRLSLGVQSFHTPALKKLGRDHDGPQAQAALQTARDIYPTVSLDLIFGWVGQTLAQLTSDLDIALAVNTDHISTYQLTLEPGTAFAKQAERGVSMTVEADMSADFYDAVTTRLTQAGYDHYEVSNFAKADHHSRHNMAYWQGWDYVGVGPGAHGRLSVNGMRYATVAALRPKAYVQTVRASGLGCDQNTALSRMEHAEEYMLMGLRIKEGISLARYADIADAPLAQAQYADFIADGLLDEAQGRLRATAKGRLLLNSLTTALLT